MEKISRHGFLKVAAAAAISGVTAGALAACSTNETPASSAASSAPGNADIYTPGTYANLSTGVACGRTVTFGRRAGRIAATQGI